MATKDDKQSGRDEKPRVTAGPGDKGKLVVLEHPSSGGTTTAQTSCGTPSEGTEPSGGSSMGPEVARLGALAKEFLEKLTDLLANDKSYGWFRRRGLMRSNQSEILLEILDVDVTKETFTGKIHVPLGLPVRIKDYKNFENVANEWMRMPGSVPVEVAGSGKSYLDGLLPGGCTSRVLTADAPVCGESVEWVLIPKLLEDAKKSVSNMERLVAQYQKLYDDINAKTQPPTETPTEATPDAAPAEAPIAS